MGPALAAGSEDAENRRVRPGKELCGTGRSGGSAEVSEPIRWDAQLRTAGLDIEKNVSRLDAVLGEAWVLVEFDELHTEAFAGAIVTGHDEKNPVVELHLRSRRHHGRGIARAKALLHGGDESARIEKTVDVSFGENVHQQAWYRLCALRSRLTGCGKTRDLYQGTASQLGEKREIY